MGVLSWQLAAAAVTGFIAKENVVGTLAVCFVGLENFINVDELAMVEGAGADVAAYIAITPVAALAYLMFNLYNAPLLRRHRRHELGNEEHQVGAGRHRIAAVHRLHRGLSGVHHRHADHRSRPAECQRRHRRPHRLIVMISVVVTLARRANRHIQEEYRLDAPNTAASR